MGKKAKEYKFEPFRFAGPPEPVSAADDFGFGVGVLGPRDSEGSATTKGEKS